MLAFQKITNFRQIRFYHPRVIDHFNNPRNVGNFSPEDVKNGSIGTGLVGAPVCGDVMKLQLKIVNNIILEAKFKTFGCGSAIAASSLATEWVKGKTVEECLQIKNSEIASHLNLPPVKLHCSMLAEEAIRKAVYDWKERNEKNVQRDAVAE